LASKGNKRFLLIMGFTCPFPGAGWWRVFNFAKRFEENGYTCTVLSSFSYNTVNFRDRSLNGPSITRSGKIKILNIIPFIDYIGAFVIAINNLISTIILLPSILLLRPNVVLISVPPADQLIPTVLISKILGRELVVDYRDEFEDFATLNVGKWRPFYRFYKKVFTAVYRKVDLIIPVTPSVADGLKSRGLTNVKVVYDGVDTEIFKSNDKKQARADFSLPQDAFIFAFIGQIYNPYRVDLVVRALKKLKQKNPSRKYLLVFAASGDVKGILQLVHDLELDDSVKYFPVMSNSSQVAKFLSCADSGLIPFDDGPLWRKTFSTKFFEYAAVGLPIIASAHDDSALSSVIKENNLGLVAHPLNVDELALIMEAISNNDKLLVETKSNTLEFAKRFDKKILIKDLLYAIEHID
jgi:glycosyltransferase involved in cell wall biosynthesis